MISRRGVVAAAAVGARLWAAPMPWKVGVPDWNLKLGANPDAVGVAARLGFDGVQISFGRNVEGGKLPLDDAALIARYKALAVEHKIPIEGTCVDRLHSDGLKNGGVAVRWVGDSIRLTRAVGSQVLLLPFFGKQATKTQAEMDYAGDALRELGAEAEKAQVILGLENENSAEENARMMERSRSASVRVYYDVGNSTNIGGYDVEREIRWLGAARICQIHLKDKGALLGQGKIQFPGVLAAMREIGFAGFANLEMDFRAGMLEEDMKTNLKFVRDLAGKV